MAYVYIHTRIDTNQIFYVGIGSDTCEKHIRASSKKKRSKFWRNIIKSTNYKVDIIYDNLSWEDACLREIELIKNMEEEI